MRRPHVVHKAEIPRVGARNTFSVWCEAGDLDLSGLTADLAERWVEKHRQETA